MSTYYHRISEILDARFDALLARWLRKLPAGGWAGTPRELAAALYAESTPGEYVGRHVATKVEAATYTLQEAGFTLTRSRTGSRRLVTIQRA